jgi:hypothetical protein
MAATSRRGDVALMSLKRASRSRLQTPSKSDPWLEVRSLVDFDFKQL